MLVTLSFPITSSFAQVTGSVDIFPIDSDPFGISYEEHVKKYWKSLSPTPTDQNPMTTGKCTFEQETSNSSVFYLAGNAGGPSSVACKIRAGLGIFIPIITVLASQAETRGATIDDLHIIAKRDQDGVTSLSLKINDKEFKEEDLRKYRTHTKEFEVIFPPEDALFDAAPGPSLAVADGYYVVTKPLSPGKYTIIIVSNLACLDPDCPQKSFYAKIIYDLIVE
jgi:hypothetical protein